MSPGSRGVHPRLLAVVTLRLPVADVMPRNGGDRPLVNVNCLRVVVILHPIAETRHLNGDLPLSGDTALHRDVKSPLGAIVIPRRPLARELARQNGASLVRHVV